MWQDMIGAAAWGRVFTDRRVSAKIRSGVGLKNRRQGINDEMRCVWMTKNRTKWVSEHALFTKPGLSDGDEGETFPTMVGLGYDHHLKKSARHLRAESNLAAPLWIPPSPEGTIGAH